MGIGAAAAAAVAGSVIGGIGADKAADKQQESANKAIDSQEDMFAMQSAWLEPFRKAGESGLAGLSALAGQPIDRSALLKDYYNSAEYSAMADQARYQQLSAAEATGGLGSTATSNGLAFIAPQLGQNYLTMKAGEQQDMYNQLLGLVNVGLSGAGAQSAAAAQNANALSSLYAQQGAINAGAAAVPWQTAASATSSLINGWNNNTSTGGLF